MALRLVVFDLDGVLVDVESSWQAVHRAFDVDNEANFRRYLQGKIDYQEFMRSDIALWSNPAIEYVSDVLQGLPLMRGARETLAAIKATGHRTAIISSGISLLADRVQAAMGIDYSYANRLHVDAQGRLTGEGDEVVKIDGKGEVLKRLCGRLGFTLGECAVIGDSVFDIPMFEGAGLSVAFNPTDQAVNDAADVVEAHDLRSVIPWLTHELSKAELLLDCATEREAASLVAAVTPDNEIVPGGLHIKTVQVGATVRTRVITITGVKTLLATINDLLSCIQAAQNVIKRVGRGARNDKA
jgi:phosphoserine phosphatase